MEQRYKEINNLITKMALGNPNITTTQIARARAIYTTDNRPLEEIERDLQAYSDEINASKSNIPSLAEQITRQEIKSQDTVQTTVSSKETEPKTVEKEQATGEILLEPAQEFSTIKHSVPSTEPVDEMAAMLNEYEQISATHNYQASTFHHENVQEKQLIKSQKPPIESTLINNENGQSSTSNLLIVTAVLSLITTIITIFTIIAN